MVTPQLEKLILEGKASYKTFVAGGSTKSVLNIGIDRWVVITDFVVYPFLPWHSFVRETDFENYYQTGFVNQMNIFSQKSYNAYVFKTNVNWTQMTRADGTIGYCPSLGSPIKYDCYLIHEQDISFTFLRAEVRPGGVVLVTTDLGNTPAGTIGRKPPLDYGEDGKPGTITVPRIRDTGILPGEFRPAGRTMAPLTDPSFTQLEFPVNVQTDFKNECDQCTQFPIVNVGYIEIFSKRSTELQPST